MSTKLSTFLNGFSPVAPLIARSLGLDDEPAFPWKDCFLTQVLGEAGSLTLHATVAYVRRPADHDSLLQLPRYAGFFQDVWTFYRFRFMEKASTPQAEEARQEVLAWLEQHREDESRLRRVVRNYDFQTAKLIWQGKVVPPPIELARE